MLHIFLFLFLFCMCLICFLLLILAYFPLFLFIYFKNGKVIDNDELQEYLDEKLGREEDNLPEDLNISKSTLDAIFSGMESVTGDSGGTAYNTFKDFGVKVAGKTGTVQVGGNKADNAWFLGFAPYDNPEIAICSVIEHGSHGTYTASIVKAILEYFKVEQ